MSKRQRKKAWKKHHARRLHAWRRMIKDAQQSASALLFLAGAAYRANKAFCEFGKAIADVKVRR